MPLPRVTDGEWDGVSAKLNAWAAEIDRLGVTCVVRRTTPAYLSNNVHSAIEWQALNVDTYGGMWNPDQPTRVTVAVPGFYTCTLQVRFSLRLADGTVNTGYPYNSGTRTCAILLNGSSRDLNARGSDRKPYSTNGEGVTLSTTTVLPLRPGDYLLSGVWQNSGAGLEALQTDFAGTYLAIARMGPLPDMLERTEDFEGTSYAFAISGSWARSSSRSRSGTYALRSAPVGHDQASDAVVRVPAGATRLTYWYAVSSEAGYDFFSVLVDGAELPSSRVSGETGWAQNTVPLAGASTVTFRYRKDVSTVAGSDGAWVDDVTFLTPE